MIAYKGLIRQDKAGNVAPEYQKKSPGVLNWMHVNFSSIVVLTGAGISAESGISTFRDANGLWENHRMEEVATPEAFQSDPALVHRFYNARRRQLLGDRVTPNRAHEALAAFEQGFTGDYLLVTQNVDNLHERAGSRNLVHMHGELLRMRCTESDLVFDITEDIEVDSLCPCCGKPGTLRPDIVWFGEIPRHLQEIAIALQRCELFIAIGTSGNVYPAAGFHESARQAGAHTVELNLMTTPSPFDTQIRGPASRIVPAYLDRLLELNPEA